MTSEPLPPPAEPEYLTEVLRRCGALVDGRVSRVVVESSRATLLSRIIRLRLTYEGTAARYHSHRNMTIVQGDADVWNIFLPQASGSDDVRIFDWDAWRLDVATDDLAYMMALHWFPDHRRRFERHLLDRYHAALLASGVIGYDRRTLDNDYRLSVLWQIATPVWQAANDIPSWIWWPHLERIFMAVDDLGCRGLLAT